MTSTQPGWSSPQACKRLQRELVTLRELLDTSTVGDAADENSLAVERARQVRIRRIHDSLADAVVGDNPPDDEIAEPGMVLTIRDDDTGEVGTFLSSVRGTEYGDIAVYSMASPLSRSIAGARPDEQHTYTLPSGVAVTVTLLEAVPYGIHLLPLGSSQ